jgi:DNA mismatch repair protein MutS2
VKALEPGTNRPALESAFALIGEAREWLRTGRELGFGALADPQGWLGRIEGAGAVLEPPEFQDVASLLETAAWLRLQFPEEATKSPLLAARAASLGDFREVHAAIRRCVLPNGEISDDASSALRRIRASITQTRDSIQKTLQQILRTRDAQPGEGYVTLRRAAAKRAGRGPRSKRHGANGFHGAVRNR